MGLRDLALQRAYDSGSSDADVLADFYVPVLAESASYDRLAGFFSSTALAVAARGIAGLIKNGGSMRLIASPHLTKADIDALGDTDEWTESPVFSNSMETSIGLDDLADEIAREHVRALAWMFAESRLEIRLATPRAVARASEGIFHQKVGVLSDADGDTISFGGSINETAAGWRQNVEEFKVFRSWEPSETAWLDHDKALFDRYWNGRVDSVILVPLPEAVGKQLLKIAPADIDELALEKEEEQQQQNPDSAASDRAKKPPVRLREYQTQAVEAWFANDCRGIFEMATGTGKTKTALECVRRLAEQGGRQLCVMSAPYQHIAAQWAEELEDFEPIVAHAGNAPWKAQLQDQLADLSFRRRDQIYVVAVQKTASSGDFIERISAAAKRVDRAVFIGDEVHGLGAPTFQRALADVYSHRLGLSATPERWFDDEGTQAIRDFFGETVFVFGIKEALNTINPETGQTVLCPYDYRPVFVHLNDEELFDYQELTEKLIKLLGYEDDPDVKERVELLLFKRAAIVKQASDKIRALEEIVQDLQDVDHCLVYCHTEDQMRDANEVLQARGLVFHRFTGTEGTAAASQFGGLSEREHILRSLASGDVDVLVAMKCLDEGVDVPSARLGIILASSTNPREFIQRRGRLLRRCEGKERAIIYDVVVAPALKGVTNPEVRALEYKLFGRELERVNEFADNALNALEARTKVLDVLAGATC